MADKEQVSPKTIMWYCKGCAHPVEVPIPEYAKRVEKLPCECGKTEQERIAKWVSMAAIALFISAFGGCWAHNHYSTEQVKTVAEKYDIRRTGPAEGFPNTTEYLVVPKPEKPVEAPKPQGEKK